MWRSRRGGKVASAVTTSAPAPAAPARRMTRSTASASKSKRLIGFIVPQLLGLRCPQMWSFTAVLYLPLLFFFALRAKKNNSRTTRVQHQQDVGVHVAQHRLQRDFAIEIGS